MDFNDTSEEADFRAAARSFLDKHATLLPPDESAQAFAVASTPDEVKRSQEWQATKYDNNWACLTWPQAHGGQDSTPIRSAESLRGI